MTASQTPFGRPFFAMDTAFGPGTRTVAHYPPHVACSMLAKLGYDQTYFTVFPWVEPGQAAFLHRVPAEYGLGVAAVYVMLDLAADEQPASLARALAVVDAMPEQVDLEVAVLCSGGALEKSDPAGDRVAAEPLGTLAGRVADKGGALLLYPHVSYWLETFDDAVRLAGALDHPAVGVCFCGFHWYAADGQPLGERLADALPLLKSVNLSGVESRGEAHAIRPLDEGQMDNFAVLALLKRAGYTGRIGIQGYGVGGDVYANLRRSRDACRDILDRLERHPQWAELASRA